MFIVLVNFCDYIVFLSVFLVSGYLVASSVFLLHSAVGSMLVIDPRTRVGGFSRSAHSGGVSGALGMCLNFITVCKIIP